MMLINKSLVRQCNSPQRRWNVLTGAVLGGGGGTLRSLITERSLTLLTYKLRPLPPGPPRRYSHAGPSSRKHQRSLPNNPADHMDFTVWNASLPALYSITAPLVGSKSLTKIIPNNGVQKELLAFKLHIPQFHYEGICVLNTTGNIREIQGSCKNLVVFL